MTHDIVHRHLQPTANQLPPLLDSLSGFMVYWHTDTIWTRQHWCTFGDGGLKPGMQELTHHSDRWEELKRGYSTHATQEYKTNRFRPSPLCTVASLGCIKPTSGYVNCFINLPVTSSTFSWIEQKHREPFIYLFVRCMSDSFALLTYFVRAVSCRLFFGTL